MTLIAMAVLVCIWVLMMAGFSLASMVPRRTTAFGVRVPAEYTGSSEGRQTMRTFQRRFGIQMLVVIAVPVVLQSMGVVSSIRLWAVVVPISFLAGRLVPRSSWRATVPYGVPAAPVRTASLLGEVPNAPGGRISLLLPFALPVAAGLYLARRWNSLPAALPRGWTERTAPNVFGPLAVVLVGLLFGSVLVALIRRDSPRFPAGSQGHRRSRLILGILTAAMWTGAIAGSFIGLIPAIDGTGQRGGLRGVPFLIVLVGGAVCFVLGMRLKKLGEISRDTTPNECWKWAMYYRNPNDASLLVEQRFGSGYALNYAHWPSWALGGIVRLVAVVSMYVVLRDMTPR